MQYSHDTINSNTTQSISNNLNAKPVQNKVRELQDNRHGAVVQKKVNNTGLPDNLKSGIENLSGHTMDDVKVHYNSDKPAQLNAHAYAQGTDIHVASGQEKHLPHEAWHVVQQKQGRVKSTLQTKRKVNVNDDNGLEKEADVMGEKSLSFSTSSSSIIMKSKPNLSNIVQKITNQEAVDLKETEEMVWYNNNGTYIKASISEKVRGGAKNVYVTLMDGTKMDVPLSSLHLHNPNESLNTQIGVRGMNIPGPSKPIAGQNVINRGETETEMINGVPHVRVYSALMSTVSFDSEDPQTGIAKSEYKDIHQNKDGKISISTGANSVLWAGMGRPLRALKWSEKYFAQILNEKPELKPVHEQYKLAVSELEKNQNTIKTLKTKQLKHASFIETNSKNWPIKKRTPQQQKSLNFNSRKEAEIDIQIKDVQIKINQNEKIINDTRTKLGNDANPVIRSFLIPFASYEKISKRAIPEELNAVVPQAEEATAIWNKVLQEMNTTTEEVDRYTKLKFQSAKKEADSLRDIKKINENKSPAKKIIKNKALKERQAKEANISKLKYEKLLEVSIEKKTKIETELQKTKKQVLDLAKKAMPDLDTTNYSPLQIVEEMKKRGLHISSINVDRHYEPNQFGVKGPDIDILRMDAVPGSLKTYVKFPETMDKTRKSESGEVHHINLLRDKLGVPKKDLSTSAWISGSDFAKQKGFEGEADKLSMFYSTWLKAKDPKFNEQAFLSKKNYKIPLPVRQKMLDDFLKQNEVSTDQKNEFMEKVIAPWASQSMIAHIMADDYDRMNKDQNITAKGGSQDFVKMRNELPSRRNKLKETGNELDLKINAHTGPKELLDLLIKDFPELKERYEKISAKSEAFTFYDHAQMVYNQFQKLSHKDKDGDRLMSKTLIGKMILFHDMEKWNSKEQYGHEGEHKLTVDEMRSYKELWKTQKEAKIAEALVNSDPFGEYMKGKISNTDAHEIITRMAKDLGFKPTQYHQFFKEYHQFFQADFSSYTDKVGYKAMDGSQHTGKPVFNQYFHTKGHHGKIRREFKKQKGRLIYDSKLYEPKFKKLEALFLNK